MSTHKQKTKTASACQKIGISKANLTLAIASINTPRSAWQKGVLLYAAELVDELEVNFVSLESLKSTMLNGARTWKEFSEGGCSLIWEGDIAERLCSPSELKKTRGGERNPNSRETWIECQARALSQALALIRHNAKIHRAHA